MGMEARARMAEELRAVGFGDVRMLRSVAEAPNGDEPNGHGPRVVAA
jgi:hypothetical protein